VPIIDVPSQIEDRLAAAQHIVREYGRVLEERESIFMSEEDLPASKEEIKKSILIVVAARKAAGTLSEKELQIYRTTYFLLAFFVPPAEASAHQQFLKSAQKVQTIDPQDSEAVEQHLREVEEALEYPRERRRESASEILQLAKEFDALFSALVDKLSKAISKAESRKFMRELFPRWKECTVLFFALTAITVFVPFNVGLLIFGAATILVALRGYRDPENRLWAEVIGWGLIGLFVGAFLFGFIATPLQRKAIIWISHQTYISRPDLFLCCIRDDIGLKNTTSVEDAPTPVPVTITESLKEPNHQWSVSCVFPSKLWPPRAHHTWKSTALLVLPTAPAGKSTIHPSVSTLDVAVQ